MSDPKLQFNQKQNVPIEINEFRQAFAPYISVEDRNSDNQVDSGDKFIAAQDLCDIKKGDEVPFDHPMFRGMRNSYLSSKAVIKKFDEFEKTRVSKVEAAYGVTLTPVDNGNSPIRGYQLKDKDEKDVRIFPGEGVFSFSIKTLSKEVAKVLGKEVAVIPVPFLPHLVVSQEAQDLMKKFNFTIIKNQKTGNFEFKSTGKEDKGHIYLNIPGVHDVDGVEGNEGIVITSIKTSERDVLKFEIIENSGGYYGMFFIISPDGPQLHSFQEIKSLDDIVKVEVEAQCPGVYPSGLRLK